MESFSSNNGKIDGYLVYKRKRKSTSFEESSEVISINSKSSKAKADNQIPACAVGGDRPNVSVEFDKSGMEYHGGAAVSDAEIFGTMVQQTPKEVKHDKLLILREVLQKSIEELDKPEKNNNEETATKQQLDPVYAQVGQAMRQKFAKLRARQKERMTLRNTRLVGPNQSSDLQRVKNGESVGFVAQCSSLMSLKGKDISILNTSLHKTNGSASGFTSSTSFCKNTDPMTSIRPCGFLKRNTKINDWSELELDALWVGVRRYGHDNWEKILADPALRYFKNRTPEDLSTRWDTELLKIFPSSKPTSSMLSTTMPDRPIQPPMSVTNGYSDATTVQFPAHVKNRSLPLTNSISSLKWGSLDTYQNASSSSRVSHSFQEAPSDPQWPWNIKLEPMVSKLLFQTLNQRADLTMNMRPVRMQALQTQAVGISTMRNSVPTSADPNFLLGRHFPLPKVRENQNAVAAGPSVTQSNPSVVETSDCSETTLSG